MKNLYLLLALISLITSTVYGQVKIDDVKADLMYVVSMQDGSEFVGKIISHDNKEVLIETENLGEIALTKYQIKEITELSKATIAAYSKIRRGKTYLITTNKGEEFAGKVLAKDDKEIVLSTTKSGKLTIPSYTIKEIAEIDKNLISASGEIMHEQTFATRYFITTNGLDIKKGDTYVLFNWYGPDVHFGVADNFSLGVMTTWFATPIVGSFKYSSQISENSSFAVGALVGTLGWTSVGTGGALPFVAYTLGNRRNNFTFSAGYGAVWSEFTTGIDGEALISVAGMRSLSNTLSFIFDSFIIPGMSDETPFTALLIPGLRFQKKDVVAFQFGFAGLYTDLGIDGDGGSFLPLPLPMASLFWKF